MFTIPIKKQPHPLAKETTGLPVLCKATSRCGSLIQDARRICWETQQKHGARERKPVNQEPASALRTSGDRTSLARPHLRLSARIRPELPQVGSLEQTMGGLSAVNPFTNLSESLLGTGLGPDLQGAIADPVEPTLVHMN